VTTESERSAIARVESRLDDLFNLVGDVRERLAAYEGRAVHRDVESLRAELVAAQARIAALEAAHNHSVGMLSASKTWGEWLHRLAPWLFAVGLVVWTYFKFPN
jgi:hypothetical protein